MRVTKQAVAAEIRTTTQERGEFTYGSDAIQYDVIRKTKPTDKAKNQQEKSLLKSILTNGLWLPYRMMQMGMRYKMPCKNVPDGFGKTYMSLPNKKRLCW